ncbi:MAG: SpoIIE family protein phosphatase [bacterium]|nr:SpoIIE family protein phosphatase [bacterium]
MIKLNKYTAALLFVFLLLTAITAAAEEAAYIELNETALSGMKIGRAVSWYEDTTGRMSINEITRPEMAEKFTLSKKESINFGYGKSPYWFKFTVRNRGETAREWYLELSYPMLDNIDLFIPEEGEEYNHKKAGDSFFYSDREFDFHNFIFRQITNPGTRTFYLRIETTSSRNFSMMIYSKDKLAKRIGNEHLLLGLIYGIFFVLFFYNLIIFISSRNIIYLYYVLFVVSYFFLSITLNGLGFRFVWPHNPEFCDMSTVFIPITAILGYVLTMSFLNTKEITPRLNILLRTMIGIYTLFIVLFFVLPYVLIMPLFLSYHLLAIIVIMLTTLVYVILKQRAAYFFFPGWFLLLCGGILTLLKNMGVLPENFITIWGVQIGVIFLLIIFSLAFADKLNILKNELQEMNNNLEEKVEHRTEELQAANEELESLNTELISTRDSLWGELELAKKIQTVLLPEDPVIPGYEITAYMDPADEVGGDYYDVINLHGRDWLVIGDVSGHGVPAGLIMMMVQTSINAVLTQNPELAPSRLLTSINKTISKNIKQLDESKYMTITVLAAHQDGAFTFSGLHQDIMIYRANTNSVELFKTEGVWIGMLDDIDGMLDDSSLNMNIGDVMLVYTDGITEAWARGSIQDHRDPEKDMFGDKHLKESFCELGTLPTEEILRGLLKELEEFSCGDDVTIVILKRRE